jgi:hypothetical protein
MIDETTSLALEHLGHIRATLDVVGDGLARVEFLTAVRGREASQTSAIDKGTQRLDRVERRLELVDDQ